MNDGSGDVTTTSENSGTQMGSGLPGEMREAVQPLKDAAKEAIAGQSAAGADRMGRIAETLNGIAPQLEKDLPQMSGYVRDAAQWVEKSAQNVREQNFEATARSIGTFARERPAAAFAIAAMAGFAVSRFLKTDAATPGMPQPNGAANAGR